MLSQEWLWFIVSGINLLAGQDPRRLYGAVLLAVFSAVAVCMACWFFPGLWNRSYKHRVGDYVACVLAAGVSFLAVVVLFGLSYSPLLTERAVLAWQTSMLSDTGWLQRSALYRPAAANDSGVKPGQVGERPGERAVAHEVATELCARFRSQYPLLAQESGGINALFTAILDDADIWLASHRDYPTSRAVAIVGTQLLHDLDDRTERLMFRIRVSVISGFLLVQSLVFGLIGYGAYRDISPHL